MALSPCISEARNSIGDFSLGESSKLNRQPPVAGFGRVTMLLISAFSAVTSPRMLLWSIDLSRSPTRSRTNILRPSPLAPTAVRENRANDDAFGVSGPQCNRYV